MTKLCGVQCLLLSIPLVWAAVLHQSHASEPEAQLKEPNKPERGLYHVTSSNGSVCLLAYMGLQFNLTYDSPSMNKTVHNLVNLKPNSTTTSGSCDADSALLRLSVDADKMNLTFHFSLNTTSSKYHLNEVILIAVWPDTKESFTAQNNSLDYLRGTLGFSYMCREEQTLDVDRSLSINTFQLQVQPFGLSENQFGAAEECQLDEDDMLIPIIVGGALAGLVLIVLLAYLIGRKRSHAGYQTI